MYAIYIDVFFFFSMIVLKWFWKSWNNAHTDLFINKERSLFNNTQTIKTFSPIEYKWTKRVYEIVFIFILDFFLNEKIRNFLTILFILLIESE
jgi:hypothetical protein